MEQFQPRFKSQPFYNDFSAAAYARKPALVGPAETLRCARGRPQSARDEFATDRVDAILHGEPVEPSAQRKFGRAMHMRDPNTETDPTVGSKRHPKLFDSHVRRLETPTPEAHATGKRHVDAPAVEEPAEDVPGLAGTHKRYAPPPASTVRGDHAEDLLVDPPVRPATVSRPGSQLRAHRVSPVDTERKALAGFFSQKAGGLRPVWVRISRGEYLEAAGMSDVACPNRDGSVPIEALWCQLEVLVGRRIEVNVLGELLQGGMGGVTMPEFARALGL
jgi:hypothetical protein